jgi:hypothetical protein
MDSNTHSTGTPDPLVALTAAVEGLATQDLNGLADAALAERVLVLRRLLDRLEGHWLKALAAVDARVAPGPSKARRRARPLGGCGPGSAWALGWPAAWSGPPGRCSAAP